MMFLTDFPKKRKSRREPEKMPHCQHKPKSTNQREDQPIIEEIA